ncbi:ABC transporter permease [Lacticaseibacillus zhaodongensis]|uniref:ABC transporter permease n=1 Tax=Lacticaseibacillus zhaodongensis TaxID=2668065 RepID=UPI0012D3385A|nr:ABC transporter permease [Lacticaseibacillus zhaodongensis]
MPEAKEAMAPAMVLLDHLSGLIKSWGIDYGQYRLIVATKFKLAARDNVGVGLALNTTSKKPSGHPVRNSFLINLLFGVFMIILTILPMPEIMTYTMYFSTLFVMTFLTMLTSYSGLMLDPRDRELYITRGVQPRTLNAARLTVVAVYLFLNVLALGVPALIGIFLRLGVFATVGTFISLLIMTEFAFMLALFVYLLVLRFFDGERLKNILNFVQIALIIGIYGGSQILPRLSGNWMQVLGKGAAHTPWYTLLSIPSWFGGLPMLLRGHFEVIPVALTVLSIVVPVALTLVYARNAGNFEQYLAKLDQASSRKRKDSWYFRISRRLLIKSSEEATYYDFGWHMLQEEREYKLRVYPSIGYALIIPIVMGASFFNSGGGHLLQQITNFGPYALIALLMALPGAIYNLAFSSQPAAMSLFLRVPMLHHGYMLRAILKAMFVRIFLPLIVVWTVVMLVLGGWNALLACVGMAVLIYAATLVMGRILGDNALPFAREFNPNKQNGGGAVGSVMITLPIIIIVIVAGGLLHTWLLGAAFLVIGLIIFFSINSGFKDSIHFDLSKIDADEH